MSKKSGMILTIIVGIAVLVAVYLVFSGTALNVSALGETFKISIAEGKDVKSTAAKLNDFIGEESIYTEKISKAFAVAYYLLIVGITVALIIAVYVVKSAFGKRTEFALLPLAIFAIVGLCYTVVKTKAEEAIGSAAGIWGGLISLSISTDGAVLLWLNVILLIVAAIIVYLSKDKTKENQI